MSDFDVHKIPVFGPANVFPMLRDDDFEALAYDIAKKGLLKPLVVAKVNGKIVLVDGRNRRAACKRAKVEPHYEFLKEGDDPTSFVISANIHRRHLSKAQQAIAVAMIHPEPAKGGRGKKLSEIPDGFSPGHWKNLLCESRRLLREAPDLARLVLAGGLPISKALEEADRRADEKDKISDMARRLRKVFPDLADDVESGKMSVEEADREGGRRLEAQDDLKRGYISSLNRFLDAAECFSSDEVLDAATKAFSDDNTRDECERRYTHRRGPENFEESIKVLNKGIANIRQLLKEAWKIEV